MSAPQKRASGICTIHESSIFMNLLKNEIDIRALPDLYTHTDGTPVTPDS